MEQKNFVIGDRQFRTERDYRLGLRDKEVIDKLSLRLKSASVSERQKLIADIKAGKYQFYTMLGEDFLEDLEAEQYQMVNAATGKGGKAGGKNRFSTNDTELESYVQQELQKRDKRRKILIRVCSALGVVCLGIFGFHMYAEYQNDNHNSEYKEVLMQESEENIGTNAGPSISQDGTISGPQFTLNSTEKDLKVLDEYKNLLNKYENLIGWLKIDDTNIDYPVMQTNDNEYYLDHNLDGKYDKNGTIFMDKECDVINGSTNLILYGHHMKSGKMFGSLNKYSDKNYYEKHKYIQFDTIYEKATYEVMYVFRSKVYSEEDVVFKYYQFIDANGEKEFQSNMNEMAAMSLYSTGVTAQYGDKLLTLSTCDYEEKDGRFVVVARKMLTKE